MTHERHPPSRKNPTPGDPHPIAASPYAVRCGEDEDYLSRQLITYLGNKRALLGPIAACVEHVKRRLGRRKLRILDAFSGSGVVSRFFKAHAERLVSNDIEAYAAVIGRCFLRNASEVDLAAVRHAVADLNAHVDSATLEPGFIEELYAPADEERITPDDRVFYTQRNARRLDTFCRLIRDVPVEIQDLLLGPLLSRASVHANTAGVFKGFYKDRASGLGRFGGSGADALSRIRGSIELEVPFLSRFECDYEVRQDDANRTARNVGKLDLVYVDPPYNQHPYGSNYFMLNLLVSYERPTSLSRVSGIPTDWQRSGYNRRNESAALLRELLESVDAAFLLVSFSDDGFISPDEMHTMLTALGRTSVVATPYNAFRGSRNLRQRKSLHVTEQLFLVERR